MIYSEKLTWIKLYQLNHSFFNEIYSWKLIYSEILTWIKWDQLNHSFFNEIYSWKLKYAEMLTRSIEYQWNNQCNEMMQRSPIPAQPGWSNTAGRIALARLRWTDSTLQRQRSIRRWLSQLHPSPPIQRRSGTTIPDCIQS